MFASFRRHKWLWVFFFGLVIISFVVFIGPTNQLGLGGPAYNNAPVGSINGKPVSREQYLDAYREAQLRYLFSTGMWPETSGMAKSAVEQETRNRLFLLQKAEELGIKVAAPAVADWIAQAFRDRTTGAFMKAEYDQFVTERLPQWGLRRADFERFAKNEVALQHLMALTGLSGRLVTPQEAKMMYAIENEQVDTIAVFFTATNYLSQVELDPSAIATFYTNRQATYRTRERVEAYYVKFAASNYFAEAEQRMSQMTNLNQLIETNYQERGPDAFKDENNQPLSPEAAKEKIRTELRDQLALVEARRKATEFADQLLDMTSNSTNNLANLAAAQGLPLQVTPPFAEFEQPPGMNVPDTFGRTVFQLTPAEPVAETPIVGEDAVYIVGLHRRLPSFVPPLEEIQARVTDDYRRARALELAQQAGREFHTQLTNSIAQGKSFQEAATEANQTPVDLPPFSKMTTEIPELPSLIYLSALKDTAFALSPNQTSSFVPTSNGGFIVHVQARVPVSDEKLQSELPEFTRSLRQGRQFEAYRDWLRAELDQARIDLPGGEQSAN